MEAKFKFGMGDKVRCRVTGREGITMSRTEYLCSGNRYGVQLLLADSYQEPAYFDEGQLELVQAEFVERSVSYSEEQLCDRMTAYRESLREEERAEAELRRLTREAAKGTDKKRRR